MASRILQIVLSGKDDGALGLMAGLGKQAEQTEGKVSKFGTAGTAALLGIGTAAAGLALKSAKTFENIGSDVLKLQRYTGGTAEDMSRLRFAAQQTGTDVDTLSKALGIASKNLVNSKDPMSQFGIAAKNADGSVKPMNEVLLATADRFAAMPNGAEKTALALKLFGRAGADLLPFLNRGRDGIAELMAETDKYGLVLSGAQLDAVKQSKAAHRDLEAALDGLQVKIGTGVLPMLTALTNGLAGIPGPVMDVAAPVLTVGAGLAGLAVVGSKVVGALRPAVDALGSLNAKLKDNGSSTAGSTAAMAGYAIAIGVTVAAIQKMNADSEASNSKLFQNLDFSDLEAANGKLNETGSKLNDMGAKWDSYSAAEKLAHAEEYKLWQDGVAQQEEHRKHLDASIETTRRLGDALGVSAKDAERFAAELKIDPTSVPFDQLVDVMRRYKNGTLDTASAQHELAGKTNEATDAAKNQSDQLAAALNPMFGMTSALQANTDAQAKQATASKDLAQAQRDYDYAVRTTLPGSQQQKDALDKLTAAKAASVTADQASAKSALDVMVASDKLNESVKKGETSVDDAKASLQRFVEQGLINQQTADNLAAKFGWAANRADDLARDRHGTITVEVQEKLNLASAHIGGMIQRSDHASGGNLTRGLNLLGERGPELVNVGPGGGNVTTAGSTSRALGGLGGDVSVTVNVGGSVVAEHDLVEQVRNGLLDLIRTSPGAVLPGIAG